jgi:anaerobic magnesium-protoporphyrin IX monomethyl ester cyclase
MTSKGYNPSTASELKTIVLVNINKPFRTRELERQAPLALMYLSAQLKQAGFRTVVEDITPSQFDRTLAKIAAIRPLFVGISLTFGFTSADCVEFSRKVKMVDEKIPIVWGGIHASAVPDLCLNSGVVDYVCIGEGERTIVEVARCFEDGGSPEEVESVGYRRSGKIFINPLRPFETNIDNFHIDWDCVDLSQYALREALSGKVIFRAYQSGRGCPYDCSFCYNSAFNNRRYRPHSVEFVMKDIEMLKQQLDIDMVEFVDDHFFTNKKRSFEILSRMKQIGVSTYNIGIRADHVDDELFRNLVDCKCRSIYCGFESENERVLEVLNKEITKENIDNVLAVNTKYPVKVSAQFMLGIPTHTKKEIICSVRYGLKLMELYPNLIWTTVAYVPLPGTRLYHKAIEEGYVPPKRIEEYKDFGQPSISKYKLPISWLPWATKRDKETLKFVLPMSAYLIKTRLSPSWPWVIRTMIKPFFKIAYWRMYNLNFHCLIDYHIFNLCYAALSALVRPLLKQPRLRGFIARFIVIPQ